MNLEMFKKIEGLELKTVPCDEIGKNEDGSPRLVAREESEGTAMKFSVGLILDRNGNGHRATFHVSSDPKEIPSYAFVKQITDNEMMLIVPENYNNEEFEDYKAIDLLITDVLADGTPVAVPLDGPLNQSLSKQ